MTSLQPGTPATQPLITGDDGIGDVPDISHEVALTRSDGVDPEHFVTALFEGSSLAKYIVDRDGRIIRWNPAAAALLGYQQDEIIGEMSTVLMPSNFHDRWSQAKRSVKRQGNVHVDSVRRHKQGHLIDVELTATAIGPTADGPPVFVVTLRDKRRERAFETENALLAELVRASPLAIIGTDVDRRICTWNAAAERLFGHAPAEAIGREIDLIVPIERRSEILGTTQRILNGEEVQFETVRVDKWGRSVPVRVFGTPRVNSSHAVIGWVLFYEEISRELASRQALKDAEAFARSILEANLDWLIVLDGQLDIIYSNRNAGRTMSVPPSGASDRENWAEAWPTDSRAELHEAAKQALSSGNARLTLTSPSASGNDLWFDVNLVRLPPNQTDRHRLLVNARDVTQRRQQEDRLAYIARELAHRSKNLLAVILGMTRTTAAACSTVAQFEAAISSRIHGLSKSHDLLMQENWSSADFFKLVRQHLQSFVDTDGPRLTLSGDTFALSPPDAQALGMALHELATNAVKYGALSVPNGRITISSCATNQGFNINWSETGGPPVHQPATRGFGSLVLEEMLADSFRSPALLEFRSEGLSWSAHIPKSHCLKVA